MKPERIAVICAAHRGNSGMFSVDSSAVSYFSSKGADFDILFAQAKDEASLEIQGKRGILLRDQQQLEGYSHVVYWGDFLNNPVYGQGDFARRDVWFKHSRNEEEAFARWRKLFSLEGFSERPTVVSVGNNFQHNFAKFGKRFAGIFADIEDRFSAILPRDAFSLKNISRAMSFDGQSIVNQGMDCAFLLPPMEPQTKADTFSYAFNRSKLDATDDLVARIEDHTGLRGVEVSDWLQLPFRNSAASFQKSRVIISQSRFVISDTYHFLINSMTLDIPVIGVGREAARQSGTLGDFKKSSLFSMLGLESRYLELSDGEAAEEFATRVVERTIQLKSGEAISDDYRITKDLAFKFRSDVDFAIFGER